MRKLIGALFSDARASLLSTLLLQPEREWFLTDLAKHLKVRPSTLQRELKNLTAAQILTRRVDGKRVYYRADERCPVLSELQGLFLKTAGLVDIIADALHPFRKQIHVAVIFGSVARGEELSRSDVDLLVVGQLGLADLASALKRMEAKLNREVQTLVYTEDEFRHKVERKEHFVKTVLEGPKLAVIGDINEYAQAATK